MRMQRMDEPEEPLWVGLKLVGTLKDEGSRLQILVLYAVTTTCHWVPQAAKNEGIDSAVVAPVSVNICRRPYWDLSTVGVSSGPVLHVGSANESSRPEATGGGVRDKAP